MYPSIHNPGYGIFVKNVIEGLCQNGFIIQNKSVIKGRGKNILEKIIKYILFYLSIIVKYFKSCDAVYIHFPTYSVPIVYLLRLIMKRKIIINYHGEDLLYPQHGLSNKLGKITDNFVSKYADLIIVPSEYYKDIVVKRKIANKSMVFVSPSGGIDETIFYDDKKSKISDDGTIHLGFVGRLEENKGITYFIKAIDILSKKMQCITTIIGYGSLNGLVIDYGKQHENVNVLLGVKQSHLPQYYRSFDLFIFPSKRLSESLGLVGLEAMACGTPVIGTNIGGISSYLNNDNGFLIDINNITNEIVESVLNYYNMTKEEKHRISLSAINTAKKYSRTTTCQLLANEIKLLLQ